MYKRTLIFIISLFHFLCQAQELIIDDSVVFKKGVYKNFEEFKYNKPSIETDFTVIPIQKELRGMDKVYSMTIYELNFYNIELQKSKNSFWGFCDGDNIYISDYIVFPFKTTYFKLDSINVYSIYKNIWNIYKPTNFSYGILGGKNSITNFQPTFTRLCSELTMLDLFDGKIKEFDKINVKYAISDDIVLSKEYKNQSHDTENLKAIIKEYNKRNKANVKLNRKTYLFKDEANELIRLNNDSSNYYDILKDTLLKCANFSEVKYITKENNFHKKILEGITVKHHFIELVDSEYKIGLWRYYYANGILKEEKMYDILGNKLYEKNYDKNGILLK